MGCPNQCVFCNQRTISGTCFFDESSVTKTIDEVLSTAGGCTTEIAFFGGSFTGIDRGLMVRLLDTAEEYVRGGKVMGIRMSTRPDYIDREIIDILKRYTVTQVELGLQSMSDKILAVSRRGHTAEDARRAVALLRDGGFEVVGQMMTGLPASAAEDEIKTAEEICSMGCAASRIYPTIVFRDTDLEKMYRSGEYAPMGLEEAVERSAGCLEVFERRGVKCLRIGLCESENLHSEDSYVAGPSHSAIGEMVMARLFYSRVKEELDPIFSSGDMGVGGERFDLEIECPVGAVSKVSGTGRQNKCKILRDYPIKKVKIVEKAELLGYNIKVRLSK